MAGRPLHGDITERILRVFYDVHWELGPALLESVYANAMAIALTDAGLAFTREARVAVYFRRKCVGAFRADMVVESVVLLEFKAGQRLDPSVEAQTINCLRLMKLEVALILHFGPKPEFKRLVVTNDHKNIPRDSADSADSAAKFFRP